jgi:hypothetical protein
MHQYITRLGLFFLVILIGVIAFAVAVQRSKKRVASPSARSLLDYLLLWPLFFDQPARRERVSAGGGFFTKGELVGVAVFVVILIIGLVFF